MRRPVNPTLHSVCRFLEERQLRFDYDAASGCILVPLDRCVVEIELCEERCALSLRATGHREIAQAIGKRYHLWFPLTETATLHRRACTAGKIDFDFDRGVYSLEAHLPLDQRGTPDPDRFMTLFHSLVHPIDSLITDLDILLGKPPESEVNEPPPDLAATEPERQDADCHLLERMWALGPHAV